MNAENYKITEDMMANLLGGTGQDHFPLPDEEGDDIPPV